MTSADPFLRRAAGEHVLSVSDLTAQVKELMEMAFPWVWVEGEISNFSRPGSGHAYFTLKDDAAQLRAVLWRTSAAGVRFPLEDGLKVVCRGRIDVYPPRGSYQLVVEEMIPKGVGALELALRKLREKLSAEGLFAEERKKRLPRFPRRVAFVTSPTGAAIRDFLEVLRRRWRGVDVLVIPVRVQGEGAAAEIAAGIRLANRMADRIDVLVVGRGGGSVEDLWCFNEEAVVRAIAAAEIPVISAVGHEIDVTLSDLAADVRALTPSEAAERIAPDAHELRASLDAHGQRLVTALKRSFESRRARVDAVARCRAFRRPADRIHDLGRRLDELAAHLGRLASYRLHRSRANVDRLAATLQSLSPLGVLARGYSLTQRLTDGQLLRDASDVKEGHQISTRLMRGRLLSRIESIELE